MRGIKNKDKKLLDQKMNDYLANVHFRAAVLGVSKVDVWKIIQNIEKYYNKKLEINTAEKDAVIQEKEEELKKMRQLLLEAKVDVED